MDIMWKRSSENLQKKTYAGYDVMIWIVFAILTSTLASKFIFRSLEMSLADD